MTDYSDNNNKKGNSSPIYPDDLPLRMKTRPDSSKRTSGRAEEERSRMSAGAAERQGNAAGGGRSRTSAGAAERRGNAAGGRGSRASAGASERRGNVADGGRSRTSAGAAERRGNAADGGRSRTSAGAAERRGNAAGGRKSRYREALRKVPGLVPKKPKLRKGKKKAYFYDLLTRIFLGAVAVIFVVNLIVPSREFSPDENRNLAQLPKISAASLANGDFFRDFNSYESDQFVGRDIWMNIRSLGTMILGNRESENVYFGKDGYLLSKPVVPDQKTVNATENAINDFSGRHSDLNMNLLMIPDAASILTDKLPRNAPAEDQISDIRGFENSLDSKIQSIDAIGVMQKNKDQKIYYKTDHHWTSLGAYEVFLGAANQLGIDTPITDNTIYTVSDSFQGTLASRSGRHISRDSIEIYQPDGTDVEYYVTYPDTGEKSTSMFMSDKLKEKDQYQVFFGGNHPVVEIRTTANNGRNLLVFKDSYANSFMQFLYPYFQSIIMVDPRYYYDDIETAITSYGITDVLFLYSADTLLADTNLADTLNASSVSDSGAENGGSGTESVNSSSVSSSSSETVGSSSADRLLTSTSSSEGDNSGSENTVSASSSQNTGSAPGAAG
ncbi:MULTISPECIES: DHHW family protein [unclassified Bilifractor]|uniref:DHHW family protein n=1 Tax=unclassified Bilifractor TaxID=2815795 RepID=UPI003F90D4EE